MIHPLLHSVIMDKNSKYHHPWLNPRHNLISLPDVHVLIQQPARFGDGDYLLKQISSYVHLSHLQADSSDIVYSFLNNDYFEDHHRYTGLYH